MKAAEQLLKRERDRWNFEPPPSSLKLLLLASVCVRHGASLRKAKALRQVRL